MHSRDGHHGSRCFEGETPGPCHEDVKPRASAGPGHRPGQGKRRGMGSTQMAHSHGEQQTGLGAHV